MKPEPKQRAPLPLVAIDPESQKLVEHISYSIELYRKLHKLQPRHMLQALERLRYIITEECIKRSAKGKQS